MVALLLSTTGFDPSKVALVVADLISPLKPPNKPVVSLLLSSFLLSPSQKGFSASLTGAAGFKGSVEKADVGFALVRVVVCVISIGLDSTDDIAKKLGIAGVESDVVGDFLAGSVDSELDGPNIETEAGAKAELPPSSTVEGSILFEDKSKADALDSRGTTVFENEKGNEVIGGSFAPVRSCSMGFVSLAKLKPAGMLNTGAFRADSFNISFSFKASSSSPPMASSPSSSKTAENLVFDGLATGRLI